MHSDRTPDHPDTSHPDEAGLARPLLSTALTLIVVGLVVGLLLVVGSRGSAVTVQAQTGSGDAAAPAVILSEDTQPLAFSHQVHVSDNAIPCQLCHSSARRGPVAGIPSVQRCVQCHRTIASNQPEIQKLMTSWEAGEPIRWLRVHDLPDYVRFTHKRHVRAGVECQTCHGNVGAMNAAEQVAPLTMGWCLDCHQERDAPRDCLVCHY